MSTEISHFIIMITVYVLYCIIEGTREGGYWHIKNTTKYIDIKFPLDEHMLWAMQRVLVGMLTLPFAYQVLGLTWDLALYAAASLSIFPFMHDGPMYHYRHILNDRLYPKKWLDQSITSTANATEYFPPVVRVVLLIAAIGVYTYIIYKAI